MPWRFRRSIGNKFFRVNFSKSGVSTSTGVPGFRVTNGPRGAFVTTGIPGSGLSNTEKIGGAHSGERNRDGDTDNGSLALIQQIQSEISQCEFLMIFGAILAVMFLALAWIFASESICGLLVIFMALSLLVVWHSFNRRSLAIEKLKAERVRLQDQEQKRVELLDKFQQTKDQLDRMDVDKLGRMVERFIAKHVAHTEYHLLNGEAVAILGKVDGGGSIVCVVVHTFDPVGVDMVRKVYGMTMRANAGFGMLFTNAVFTRSAVDEAKGKPINMYDGEMIVAMMVNGKLTIPADAP